MPDLLQTLIARKQQEIQQQLRRNYMPPQAGDADPTTMRATAEIRKEFPQDMFGVQVQNIPWDKPQAVSNVLGYTQTPGLAKYLENKTIPDSTIFIAPGSGILDAQGTVQSTLAHELEHVRQARTRTPDQEVKELVKQGRLPYNDRPDEQRAFQAEAAYNKEHGDLETEPPYGYPGSSLMLDSLNTITQPARDHYNEMIRKLKEGK